MASFRNPPNLPKLLGFAIGFVPSGWFQPADSFPDPPAVSSKLAGPKDSTRLASFGNPPRLPKLLGFAIGFVQKSAQIAYVTGLS